jgi:hypothetical protein
MKLSEVIVKLTELKQKHDDMDLSFEVRQESEPDSPLGNDFVDIQVDKDTDGFYAVFVTKPKRSA